MNNKKILELKYLLDQKKKQANLNPLDKEKIENLEYILNDENLFFKIDYVTAVGILKFLGISEEKILNYYSELISPKYFKNSENSYVTISNIK